MLLPVLSIPRRAEAYWCGSHTGINLCEVCSVDVTVYDLNMRKVAYLENAFGIGYEERFNELWTASFSLPADDEKNAECKPFYFVEIFDGDERVDLFRIIPTKTQRSADGSTISYSCEHVLATLLDDILFQYHQIGGAGVPIGQVIAYILSKQSTPRWQLGTVDFATEFEYNFENENLLSALWAVTEPLDAEYQWTWDTSAMPWTLNLRAAEQEVSAYIRYGKNLVGITVDEDPSQIVTRLYPLGYGEGVNQLDIRSVNPTGLPYIDADTIGEYGVIATTYVDRSIDNAETLYATAKAYLERYKRPRRTYSVDGAELYRLTNDPIDKFRSGALVRIIDEELGVDVIQRVHVRARPDINEAPGDAQLQIANKVQDIATGNADILNRQRIMETYAQGATNIDTQNFADNCDPTHPAVLRFWVPEGTARINKVSLTYQSEAFRAYERAIAAAPATTTEAGGGIVSTKTGTEFWNFDEDPISPSDGVIGYSGSHNHGGEVSSDGSHSHSLARHFHDFSLPDHTHGIPSHTHEIEYGIFEGPMHTAVTVSVDGNIISGLGINESEVDLIPYLSVDAEGKIKRGQWHEITVTPNGLGRIVATVAIQLFVQSRGGGDY